MSPFSKKGRFSGSKNIDEFKEKLYKGEDAITTDGGGKLDQFEKFDSTFFDVNAEQAQLMDPQIRMLLETAYECIIDAGYNPAEVRGSNTGVFIGVSASESNHPLMQDVDSIKNISSVFNLAGPSYAVDTACTSSLYAMHQAVTAIRNGVCDSAIVGGANILSSPGGSLRLSRHRMLSPDGACKSFDSSANGYVMYTRFRKMF